MKKEDFYNTKWDVTDWTEEMKTQWQEKCFGLGFQWCSKDITAMHLDSKAYYLDSDDIMTRSTIEYFSYDDGEIKVWNNMFPEEQLELNLDLENTYQVELTQSEVNTLTLLLDFVANDEHCDNIRGKLEDAVEHDLVEDTYERVIVQQACVEEGSLKLPFEGVSLYESGYVIKIKD